MRIYDRCVVCLPGSSAAASGISMPAKPWVESSTGGLVGSMASAGSPTSVKEQVNRNLM